MNGPIPIIRLEVEGMKHTIAAAMTEYAAQMDADLQKAVEDYCTSGNIANIVRTTAYSVMDQVIREEVRSFFVHGNGREAIKEAVKQRLDQNATYTVLDEKE